MRYLKATWRTWFSRSREGHDRRFSFSSLCRMPPCSHASPRFNTSPAPLVSALHLLGPHRFLHLISSHNLSLPSLFAFLHHDPPHFVLLHEPPHSRSTRTYYFSSTKHLSLSSLFSRSSLCLAFSSNSRSRFDGLISQHASFHQRSHHV